MPYSVLIQGEYKAIIIIPWSKQQDPKHYHSNVVPYLDSNMHTIGNALVAALVLYPFTVTFQSCTFSITDPVQTTVKNHITIDHYDFFSSSRSNEWAE